MAQVESKAVAVRKNVFQMDPTSESPTQDKSSLVPALAIEEMVGRGWGLIMQLHSAPHSATCVRVQVQSAYVHTYVYYHYHHVMYLHVQYMSPTSIRENTPCSHRPLRILGKGKVLFQCPSTGVCFGGGRSHVARQGAFMQERTAKVISCSELNADFGAGKLELLD